MSIISVSHLYKEYQVAKRQEGMYGAIRSLFHREYISKLAVDNVSFSIKAGEMVGYIGPNGAGKSTTIKMLTGILVPSGGEIFINNIVPYKERQKNAKQIGVVFGQRTQLWWDLPTIESFELLRRIYQIPDKIYRQNMSTFNKILELEEFSQTPVRQLSLGQRMRADIAASLLHNPVILFLDEPTIGLDVVAKERIRTFIKKINQERGVTVILTTHDMSDIEKLCKRMILIDKGSVVYDGELATIKNLYGKTRLLIVDLEEAINIQSDQVNKAELIKQEGNRIWLQFKREEMNVAQLIGLLSERYEIKDIMLKEPEIDQVIRQLYENGINQKELTSHAEAVS